MTSGWRSAWIVLSLLSLAGLVTDGAHAQSGASMRSAPISDVAYEVTFNAATAPLRQISVSMSFRAEGAEPVILSLPAWTPGAYSLDNFARNISNFSVHAADDELHWDKLDYDTWRVFPAAAGAVTVSFDYRADELDTPQAWAADDLVFFNGTNLFMYPEGQSFTFPSRVTIKTEPDWQVATGMTPGSSAGAYVAADFHELVDMPTFIGRFDLDSAEIDGVLHRLATYPTGLVQGDGRKAIWSQIRGMMGPMAEVFNDTPFETYTTLMVFRPDFGGLSALEHRNSHLGIYHNQFIGSEILASVTAHEIFHAWNVKRLRPAGLVPYDYSRPQPTTLLWVSEGITDYYENVVLVRGGVYGPGHLYRAAASDIENVDGTEPAALEDASLSAWISPRDTPGNYYYFKGAAAGLLLDILIRDATDNRASLDDVMRDLYQRTYKRDFTGFTEEDWWDAVERAAGKSFEDFYARYVDGREPYPWTDVLPLAGLTVRQDTTVRPLVGILAGQDSTGVLVTALSPDGAALAGGVREGDYLLSAGPVELTGTESFEQFRAHFAELLEGTRYDVVVRRGGETLTLELELRLSEQIQTTLIEDPDAPEKAIRIRESLVLGT